MEDGPGVSINRTGGLSSPTCCVMTFCPSLFLYLILAAESRTARESAFGDSVLLRRELQFLRNPHTRATDNLGGAALPPPPLRTDKIGNFPASNPFNSGIFWLDIKTKETDLQTPP